MNFLTKKRVWIVAVPVLLYLGYETLLSRKLSPPSDSERVTVSFRVPAGVTLLPLGGLYQSDKCTNTRFTGAFTPYKEGATTGVSLPFVSGDGNLQTVSIPKDGGGRCRWKLSSVRVGFRVADDNPLAKGKEVIETSYIFDLWGYGASEGFGAGRSKEASGDLDIRTDFFPEVFISHVSKKKTVELFGGDTDYEKWSRRYQLSDAENIFIAPIVHFNKVVTLEGPSHRPGHLTVNYPDGSSAEPLHISPDYEKLLSMK